MRCPTTRPTAALHRRGLTLVELLVTIALMLLIMSVIVGVFTSATDAMTGMKKDQELASEARRLETVIQQDLRGATARFTPPLNPADNLGYFEYGENSFSDPQGEDTDDYLAFTTKAPPGQPFTGRVMLPRGVWPAGPLAGQPRYLPATITSDTAEVIYFLRHGNLYRRVLLVAPNQTLYADLVPVANPTGFRFAGVGSDGFSLTGANAPEVSWQGVNDISARPSNALTPANNAPPIANTLGDLTNRHNRFARPRFTSDFDQNGADDDFVGLPGPSPDGVPDFSPTLTPGNAPLRPNRPALGTDSLDTLAFPFLFPSAYSKSSPAAVGSINIGPTLAIPSAPPFSPTTTNHSPLDPADGDNLPVPTSLAENWTFWGFPTWAETRNPRWTAANKRLAFDDFQIPAGQQAVGLSWVRGGNNDLLPPQGHWYSDAAAGAGGPNLVPPASAWQDDLLATNVRSFDIKVLDPNAPAYTALVGVNMTTDYYDLGYGLPLKLTFGAGEGDTLPGETTTLGHEGRIPPLPTDNRVDYHMEQKFGLLFPIGDNNPNTVRLRRVWDTWSTDYAFAPFKGIDPSLYPPLSASRPVYPSYPPPYPEPLRGIQIQVRLASPDNQVLKVITIRHDFTDKL
ncbi:PulJ/GspJ family protein [Tautonia marina]|uniref:PulJ/GspJ family protein n=1 Tax=Tautonia marina TaxID=2653855 RepID=UPI0012608920|nr:prepilin-type N-terminal cleavage/methylation domain-containing protein [Tautonia marina]